MYTGCKEDVSTTTRRGEGDSSSFRREVRRHQGWVWYDEGVVTVVPSLRTTRPLKQRMSSFLYFHKTFSLFTHKDNS